MIMDSPMGGLCFLNCFIAQEIGTNFEKQNVIEIVFLFHRGVSSYSRKLWDIKTDNKTQKKFVIAEEVYCYWR